MKWLCVIMACSSALLYSLSFIMLDRCYYLVIPALAILFSLIYWEKTIKNCLLMSISWAVFVVYLHHIWVFFAIRSKLAVSVPFSLGIYLLFSSLHLICFTICFSIAPLIIYLSKNHIKYSSLALLIKILLFLISFPVAGLAITFIFDVQGGYNLLSPLIPLSRFFVRPAVNAEVVLNIKTNNQCFFKNIRFVVNLKINRLMPPATDVWGRAHYLFHHLSTMEGDGVVATPESFFTLPLNEHPLLIGFIRSGLRRDQYLLLGGQYKNEKGQLFQAVYALSSQRIEGLYLKQHAVPFFEHIPWYAQRVKKIGSIFKNDQPFACAHPEAPKPILQLANTKIFSKICSDFFLVTTPLDLGKLRHRHGENLVVVLHVNDTWFVGYMRTLLRQVAFMRAWLARVNLVYVGYPDESANQNL